MPNKNQNKKGSSVLNTIMPFVIGGGSGMLSTILIQPIDMIKVQIQIQSEIMKGAGVSNPVVVMRQIVSQHGVGHLYHGIGSALMRQFTYTTTRMGIYKSLFNRHNAQHGHVSLGMKSLFSATAGFFGSITGNPADLILIRMQADMTLPEAQRRHYTGFMNAFSRIVREEGFFSLWRGSSPTIIRAVVLNLAMLAPFDECKERLNKIFGKEDNIEIRLASSAIAGFLAAFCSLPFDNLKTKLQKMKYCENAKAYPYKNIADCFQKSVKNEGGFKLWAGFMTYYTRIAPHAMTTLLLQDYFTKKWQNYR